MLRLALQQFHNGQDFDLYIGEGYGFTVTPSPQGVGCIIDVGEEKYFVRDTREAIAAQVQP